MTREETFLPSRRTFLRTGVLAASSLLMPKPRAQEPPGRLDRYGGLRSVKFEATGYFRIEKRERWWFVTPDGHGWLGFGVNHVHPAWLRAPYNREVWLKRFDTQRPDDAAWQTGLRELVQSQMAAVGYNHFGVHNDLRAVAGLGFPEIRSIAFVNIPHNRVATAADFPDVFAPTFEAHCDVRAEQVVASHRDNPLVIGWAFTDCPILTDAGFQAQIPAFFAEFTTIFKRWQSAQNLGTERETERFDPDLFTPRWHPVHGNEEVEGDAEKVADMRIRRRNSLD